MTKARFTDKTGEIHQPFILMSSIGTDAKKADGTANIKELQHLKEKNEFIQIYDKLAALQNEGSSDPGIHAVYDLILASKATSFATCSLTKYSDNLSARSRCTKKAYDVCKRCTSVSKVGKLASELRPRVSDKSTTYDCWPVDGDSQMVPLEKKQNSNWVGVSQMMPLKNASPVESANQVPAHKSP